VSFVFVLLELLTIVINLKYGLINNYPFDVYTRYYYILAYTSPNANASFDGNPLPLSVYIQGAVQGYIMDSTLLGLAADGSQLQIQFTFRRSVSVKAFAIILFLGVHTNKSSACTPECSADLHCCSNVDSEPQHFRCLHNCLVHGEDGP
jgi:Domain of unknown function (DUF4436)